MGLRFKWISYSKEILAWTHWLNFGFDLKLWETAFMEIYLYTVSTRSSKFFPVHWRFCPGDVNPNLRLWHFCTFAPAGKFGLALLHTPFVPYTSHQSRALPQGLSCRAGLFPAGVIWVQVAPEVNCRARFSLRAGVSLESTLLPLRDSARSSAYSALPLNRQENNRCSSERASVPAFFCWVFRLL